MQQSCPKHLKHLVVKPGAKVDLGDIDPRKVDFLGGEETVRERLTEDITAIDALQDRLYAEGKRALLVVLQGTDTSGKDGTIRGVFNATGPLGVSVTAFKKPSEEELAHDFLWRVHLAAPRRGTIGIFNRSQYEDVLIGRVRKLAPKEVIEQRYEQINDFERILAENGTVILKFMLHISRKEQAERLQERLDDKTKNWKFNAGDLEDRKLWDEYQKAYETALSRCSTEHAPWHVVPADRKWARNAIIAAIVRDTLEAMDPQYPKLPWKPSDFRIE
ncbi:polyphosphate kinase 2 family protein [Phreatobacter sp.]|uniref:polyphosphate kinase 2 family protein n=1 Tax=Phreatobacter sp. TaxID=1966341 RepID=UPI0022C00BD1|nr:polyphosphate kinase 2 family protein [Phreatobacter sp.]MCZ8314765.1 polyphosphate kinase 2 family protein [Phreatobacter sp.]